MSYRAAICDDSTTDAEFVGSIGTLSVAAVLMYQAAWSALSIAVCALKQHN